MPRATRRRPAVFPRLGADVTGHNASPARGIWGLRGSKHALGEAMRTSTSRSATAAVVVALGAAVTALYVGTAGATAEHAAGSQAAKPALASSGTVSKGGFVFSNFELAGTPPAPPGTLCPG